jgi:hypothetical protein
MGCIRVAVKDACVANGHLKVTTSIVCSVKSDITLTSLLDSLGRVLLDSKGRKLVIR